MSELTRILNEINTQNYYKNEDSFKTSTIKLATTSNYIVSQENTTSATTTATTTATNTTALNLFTIETKLKSVVSDIFDGIMELDVNNMHSLIMLFIFALFLYIFTKKCHSYYRYVCLKE